MTDNIVLRLHGATQPQKETKISYIRHGLPNMIVPAHYELYKRIMQFKGKTFTITRHYTKIKERTNEVSADDFLIGSTSNQLNDHYLALEKYSYTYADTVKERNKKVTGKYRVPSSTYDVVFSVNIDGGFVEINVNIPKYLYGHNLAQFIPQINSRLFNSRKGDFNLFDTQRYYLFDRLNKFIDNFLLDLFSYFELDEVWNYELYRIKQNRLVLQSIF